MSSGATLEAFEKVFAKVQARNRTAAQKVLQSRTAAMVGLIDRIAQPSVRSMLTTEREYLGRIQELEQLQREVRGKIEKKWLGITVQDGPRRVKLDVSNLPAVRPLRSSFYGYNKSVYDSAREQLIAASDIRWGRPFRVSARGKAWSQELYRGQTALDQASFAIGVEQNGLTDALSFQADQLCAEIALLSGKDSAVRADRPLAESETSNLALAKLSGSIGEGIPYPLPKAKKGHGRLVFQCGWTARDTTLTIEPKSVGRNRRSVDVGFRPLHVPYLLDLVQWRGLQTADEVAVRSFILRMLHTLPAGSVTLSVYDPAGMGDFVKYLYPLGDKQEMILGKEGVFSTFKQLQELLEEVERHIAVINQKYLSGTYKDLVAYNQDAGVTFEPYRVLVINDDPSKWEASYRKESVEQLQRIIGAGSKCGVFVIVRSDSLQDLGLPVLAPNRTMDAKYLVDTVASRPSRNPIDPTKAISGESGKIECTLDEKVTWWPPDESLIHPQGVAQIVQGLERELDNARTVEVSPRNVAAIARLYRDAQEAKGVRFGPPVVEFDDPDGWWRETTTDGLFAYVGVDKANQKKPRLVSFRGTSEEFGILIGGQPGSGKSVFLHTLISELVRRYAPSELELYLIDVKFGSEFKQYARAKLPHARVVALESGAEFALSVLATLEDEMAKRYELFKRAGVAKIDDYREKTKTALPRILAIIDEFSGLFEEDNAASNEAKQHLTRLIQQGRAAGVHLVLASQSLSTACALPRPVLQQIPQRIVFKVPVQDSTILLADDNPRASLLNRAGEGIFNQGNGRKDANEEFQGTLTTPSDLQKTLVEIVKLSKAHGVINQPVVLENPGAASWNRDAIRAAKEGVSASGISIPIGLPLSLDPCVRAQMKLIASGNALVCIENETAHNNVISAFMLAGALAGTRVMFLDFADLSGKPPAELVALEEFLSRKIGKRFTIVKGRNVYAAIDKLRALADISLASGKPLSPPIIGVVSGLARANELNQASPESAVFQELLSKGAAAGIHLVVAGDSLVTVKSRLGFGWAEVCSVFISGVCGNADSYELVQSDVAANLDNGEQVIIYERLTGKAQKVRPFRLRSFPMGA